MREKTDHLDLGRVKVFFGLILLIFALLLSRIWYLQMIRGEEYEARARRNSIRMINIMAPRGIFFDRHMEPLVNNRLAFTVSVGPDGIPRAYRDEVVSRLSRILGMTEAEVQARLVATRNRHPYEPYRIKEDVSLATVIMIEELRLELPGVIIEEVPVRNYIMGDFFSHFVGYLGRVQEEEMRATPYYRSGDWVGRVGLERLYEQDLRGERGAHYLEVNSVYRAIRVLETIDPLPGRSLVLTVDREIQKAAEKALADRIEYLRHETEYTGVMGGSAVLMNVWTGEILAITSKPSYDPNIFVGSGSSSRIQQLNTDPTRPQFNRVISGTFPPGSSFKPIVAAAALELGLVQPNERFFCSGIDPISGKKCWSAGHGWVTFMESLPLSCNIVYYELGRRLGHARLSELASQFGFGRETGLALVDQPGWVPFRGDVQNMAIGQGELLVTPLQMAVSYAALATGGYRPIPQLVREVITPSGEAIWSSEPQYSGRVNFSSQTFSVIRESMKRTTQPRGTAYSAFMGFPIEVASKTGTGEVANRDSHAWYAAWAPANNPEVVVVVMIEHGGGGGRQAAPVARKILEAYFKI